MRSLRVFLTGDTTGLEKALARAEYKLKKFNTGAGGSTLRGSGMNTGLLGIGARSGLMAAGGAAVAAGLGSSVREAISFEKEMRNVNTIAKVSDDQLTKLGDQLKKLSPQVAIGPADLARGLYDIVSSGFAADDAISILAASAKAASAGMTDTATASKGVVAVLNAYHLSASEAARVSDVLFQEVNFGVNTFEELAQNLGMTVPQAAALKIPFEQIAAALALITKGGTSMDEAATQLSRVLTSLIKPSKALQDEFRRMGFASGQAAVESLGFSGVLQRLSDDAAGNQQKIAAWLGEVRGIRGVLNLTGTNIQEYNRLVGEMANASDNGGAAQQAFAEQSKSTDFKLRKLNTSVTNLKTELGEGLAPTLGSVADGMVVLISLANKLGSALGGIKLPGGGSFGSSVLTALMLGPNLLKSQILDRIPGGDGSRTGASGAPGISSPPAAVGNPGVWRDGSSLDTPSLRSRIPAEMRNQWFDDAIRRRIDRVNDVKSAGAQVKTLEGIRADVQKQLAKTKDATRKLTLGDVIVQLNRQITGIWEDQAQTASRQKETAKRDASDAAAKAARKLREANEAAVSFADKLKRTALGLLDRRQGKNDWQRGLVDAKEQLRIARAVGGPAGIREANRAVQDAEMARKRWIAEGAVARPINAKTATFIINGMTVTGVNNVQEFIDAVNKAAKRTAGQSRGVSISDARKLLR